MMTSLFVVLMVTSLTPAAGSPGARLEASCMKQMSDEPKRQSICHCLQVNLLRKAKPADVALLADVYEGKSVAAVKLQKPEFSALAEMDASAAENCAANPDWKITDAKSHAPQTDPKPKK